MPQEFKLYAVSRELASLHQLLGGAEQNSCELLLGHWKCDVTKGRSRGEDVWLGGLWLCL